MKVAAAAGVLGEKIMQDSTYNSLVNDQGLPNSNVEGDLKVEHQNLEFKTGLLNLAGEGFEIRNNIPNSRVPELLLKIELKSSLQISCKEKQLHILKNLNGAVFQWWIV